MFDTHIRITMFEILTTDIVAHLVAKVVTLLTKGVQIFSKLGGAITDFLILQKQSELDVTTTYIFTNTMIHTE